MSGTGKSLWKVDSWSHRIGELGVSGRVTAKRNGVPFGGKENVLKLNGLILNLLNTIEL